MLPSPPTEKSLTASIPTISKTASLRIEKHILIEKEIV